MTLAFHFFGIEKRAGCSACPFKFKGNPLGFPNQQRPQPLGYLPLLVERNYTLSIRTWQALLKKNFSLRGTTQLEWFKQVTG